MFCQIDPKEIRTSLMETEIRRMLSFVSTTGKRFLSRELNVNQCKCVLFPVFKQRSPKKTDSDFIKYLTACEPSYSNSLVFLTFSYFSFANSCIFGIYNACTFLPPTSQFDAKSAAIVLGVVVSAGANSNGVDDVVAVGE